MPNTRVYPNKTGWDNSWAKWSPEVGTANDSKLLLVDLLVVPLRHLAAARAALHDRGRQAERQTSNVPAVYLWNQDLTTSNHTPSWEAYQIPIVP